MASIINTNLQSINAQRNLNTSTSSLAVSMQRLSTGLRVNSAKDDAAGLSIATRMDSQVRGMNVAIRNANDGISMAQTAESALGSTTDSLQRMRELAVQARNSTNSAGDRASLNEEFQQLASEISRVLGGTTFNGKRILGDEAGSMSFQIGANTTGNDRISVETKNLNTGDSNIFKLTSDTSKLHSIGGEGLELDDTATIHFSTGFSDINITVADVKTYIDGGATNPKTESVTIAAGNSAISTKAQDAADEAIVDFQGSKVTWSALNAYAEGGATLKDIHDDDIFTSADSTNAALAENARDGATVMVGDVAVDGDKLATYLNQTPSGTPAVVTNGLTGTYTVFADGEAAQKALDSALEKAVSFNIDDVIKTLDNAINDVNSMRAQFGAVQSRFDAVIANLEGAAENQAAARSRIMDADFAAETANLSRTQVLQQAGNAMVAMANQAPQQVLALLPR